MDALTCGICLDNLRAPVCTPCGHLCCEACLKSYIEASADALSATCPTCRSAFPITIPDLRLVPQKYHSFIIPGIRRVFLPTDDDDGLEHAGPSQSRRDLVAQIAALNAKVAGLTNDKALLMDRCEAAIRARHAHAQGERNERLEKEREKREKERLERDLRLAKEQHDSHMRELRKKYECVKGKYKALKASRENAAPPVPKPPTMLSMKRKSTNSPGLEPASDGEDDTLAHRSQRRIPKRPRLLGSPFDLTKRIETRSQTLRSASTSQPMSRSRMLLDEDELHDSDFDSSPATHEGDSSLSSSVGPQHSGLPMGDIFSPDRSMSLAGLRDVDFDFEAPLARPGSKMRTRLGLGGGLRPAWLLSPEENID